MPCLPRATAIARGYDDILVMFGDTPLIEPARWLRRAQKLAEGAAVVVIGFRTPNPTGYGRLIEKGGELVAIREEQATAPSRGDEDRLLQWRADGDRRPASRSTLLDAVGNDNAKGEYYLTDIVEIAARQGPRGRRDRSAASKACSASTTAPSSPRPKPSGRRASGAR